MVIVLNGYIVIDFAMQIQFGGRDSMPKDKSVDLTERILETHYTPQQAQKVLGMDRDTFNNYVRRGTIHRVTFVDPKGHGYFKKQEIDALAEKIEALLIAAENPDFTYRGVGRTPDGKFSKQQMLEDLAQENRLATVHFGERYGQSPERMAARRRYVEVNPDSTYYLFNYSKMIASINIVPLSHDALLEFQEGKRGWQFSDDKILQYEPGFPLELIIIDTMVTSSASPRQQDNYVSYLLRGLSKTMQEWGSKGIEIKSIDACGSTDKGEQILQNAGFTFLGEHNNRRMYYLEIEESNLKLLQPYKTAWAEWQQKQSLQVEKKDAKNME